MIDLENGGAIVMRKISTRMSGIYDQDNFTFPSAMTLRFGAMYSVCLRVQRKYWLGGIVAGLLLTTAVIIIALILGSSSNQSPDQTKNYSKSYKRLSCH